MYVNGELCQGCRVCMRYKGKYDILVDGRSCLSVDNERITSNFTP